MDISKYTKGEGGPFESAGGQIPERRGAPPLNPLLNLIQIACATENLQEIK